MHASPPPLRLAPRPSRRAIALALLAYGLTAALLLAMPLPLALRCSAALVVVAAAAWALRQLSRAGLPESLAVGHDGGVTVARRDGSTVRGRLLPDTYVGGALVALVWKPDAGGWPRSLLLLADSLDRQDFRQLRVALRYARIGAPDPPIRGADDG